MADQDHPIIPIERELIARVGWFIVLRWFAGVGVCLGAIVGVELLHFPLPVGRLLAIGGAIVGYNAIFWLHYRRLHPNAPTPEGESLLTRYRYRRFIHIQIAADWLALAFVVHASGGIQSPVLFFFVFHMLISALLLPTVDCYVQATLVILLVNLIAWLEYAQILPHYPLNSGQEWVHTDLRHVSARLFFFAVALYVMVYLATSVARALRIRERRLMILQTDLQKAYQELETATMAKSQFILMVTHELRSPLAAVQSMLKVILGGYAGSISDKARELIERCERRMLTLLDLVRDLLDLAADQIDRLQSTSVEVDLMPTVRQVLDGIQGRAEAKGVQLETHLPEGSVILESDERDMERLLENLLSNAVKYTPSGGQVRLQIEVDEESIRIEVADTGIGIPEEDLPMLFTEFFRASNAKQVIEHGTGLGLSIVKRIVEQHGGEISVQSKLGEGTTFMVRLPRRRTSA